MSISLDTPLGSLLSNKRRVSTLKSFGIVSVNDALTYYPFRVADPVPPKAIREARPGESMAFAATVRQCRVIAMNARRGYRLEAVVDDSDFAVARRMPDGTARLVFFSGRKGYIDWMAMRLAQGARVVVSGTPSEYMGQLQFTHPDIVTIAPSVESQPAEGAEPAMQPGHATPQSGAGARRMRSYDAATCEEGMERVCRPRPVYHASARLSSERIHETIVGLLWMLGGRDMPAPGTDDIAVMTADDEERFAGTLAEAIPDILPERIRVERGLMRRAEAFRSIHDPASVQAFHQGIATLRYEEAFVCQTALLQARRANGGAPAHPCAGGDQGEGMVERFIASLPFRLTSGQRQVIADIRADMAQSHPMQRLLQGEVGSGKTVVALAAMLQAVEAGYQAVLVAPTQVLAEQHAETIRSMVEGLHSPPIPVTLITGGMKLAARRKAHAIAASGEPGVIVATHAAFSTAFQASNLALVVIDEQHRFGVEQRESLQSKPIDGSTPHMLVMTATPIPRTAAMTWFGDLDISWLTELPGGRKPIRTFVINEADGRTMANMFSHIRARIDAGERAYIVCARIDDPSASADGSGAADRNGTRNDDANDAVLDPYVTDDDAAQQRPPLHTVTQIKERLQRLPQFQGIAFATLTGRDKDEVKTQVMADFASGKTPVLVSTTVIEVGVDVPQASCMVIFDADRYGLSQLHQLRGRVGRGGTDSWAFLISRAEPGSIAESRLEVIHDSLDGAQIAQADLEFRGAGDVLGDTQSGTRSSLKLLRVVKDADLIVDARSRAERMLAEDPELKENVQLAGAVLDFARGNEAFLTSN